MSARYFAWFFDVVPGVDDHEAVDRRVGQQRVVGIREHAHDVANARVAHAPVHVADHVRADVDRVHASRVAHGAREAQREVARAGADVRHHLARAEREGLQHLVRLLVGVALGILERGDVRHRVVVPVVHLLRCRGGLRERGRVATAQESTRPIAAAKVAVAASRSLTPCQDRAERARAPHAGDQPLDLVRASCSRRSRRARGRPRRGRGARRPSSRRSRRARRRPLARRVPARRPPERTPRDRERDRRRARRPGRGAVDGHALDLAQARPEPLDELLAARVESRERRRQPRAPVGALGERGEELDRRGGADDALVVLGPGLQVLGRGARARARASARRARRCSSRRPHRTPTCGP